MKIIISGKEDNTKDKNFSGDAEEVRMQLTSETGLPKGFKNLTNEGSHIHMASHRMINKVRCIKRKDNLAEYAWEPAHGKKEYVQVGQEQGESSDWFLHRHDFFELVYLVSGELTQYIGNGVITQRPGEVVMLGTNMVHTESSDKDFTAIYLPIAPNMLGQSALRLPAGNVFSKFLNEIKNSDSRHAFYAQFTPRGEDLVQALLEQIYTEEETNCYGKDYVVFGLTLRFLAMLNSSEYYDTAIFSEALDWDVQLFRRIEKYLYDRCGNVKISELTEVFHYTGSFYNKFIKRYTGQTFSEYRQAIKLRKAKELLITTDDSIREIIRKVGYENRAYFYRVFFEQTQMTPQHFRTAERKRIAETVEDTGGKE